ncbi:MAG: hypothetical protein CBC55_00745 [Gammaproteobacteria bacterium TMED95]|nr:MAG: hypothetical protein CBC55_00745 [Gammaproteobacteria bacterium TMED95]|tara:strand:- start:4326 stop:4703 length:378 start_codon:yes stop_codon:yes gene_type:complete
MFDFIDKKKRQAHFCGEIINLDFYIFIFLAGGCVGIPGFYAALLYELGVIKYWGPNRAPSFGLWYFPAILYAEYLGVIFLTKIRTKKVIYCYDEKGTPHLRGGIKYPMVSIHILAIIVFPFIFLG